MSWYEWLVGADEDSPEGFGISALSSVDKKEQPLFDARPSIRRDSKDDRFARVFVRVYDLGPGFKEKWQQTMSSGYGGALHTGVEVYGREWSFSMTVENKPIGVTWCRPGQNPDHRFRETLSMGYTCGSASEVQRIIDGMKSEWNGNTFNMSTRNSHHFSEALCYRLGVARLPVWVTSLEARTAAPTAERVYVRVYDLGQTFVTRWHNSMLKSYGAFHSAVELYGREWSFGMTNNDWSTGVTEHLPGQNADHSFRETLSMGVTRCSEAQVLQIIHEMKREWRGCTYNLFARNCHNFSDAFCQRLGVGRVPPWVNDLASSFAADPEAGTEAGP